MNVTDGAHAGKLPSVQKDIHPYVKTDSCSSGRSPVTVELITPYLYSAGAAFDWRSLHRTNSAVEELIPRAVVGLVLCLCPAKRLKQHFNVAYLEVSCAEMFLQRN